MRSPNRRKIAGKRMKSLTVKVEEKVVEELVSLAPNRCYGDIITKLVKGAIRRKKKRSERIAVSNAISVVNPE